MVVLTLTYSGGSLVSLQLLQLYRGTWSLAAVPLLCTRSPAKTNKAPVADPVWGWSAGEEQQETSGHSQASSTCSPSTRAKPHVRDRNEHPLRHTSAGPCRIGRQSRR